jgi:hypothetical protein
MIYICIGFDSLTAASGVLLAERVAEIIPENLLRIIPAKGVCITICYKVVSGPRHILIKLCSAIPFFSFA